MIETLEKESKSNGKIKLYSIHSQKGGVGKTSIAIAIAGLEAIFNKKKVLLIDADLTGTSIKDVLGRKDEKAHYKYINDVILAAPDEFMNYTPLITKRAKKKSTNRGLAGFYYESEISDKIFFSPSSPDYKDVLEIIPLISQEDYLHFFRHRFEDIIVTAINDGFEVIILDLSPGFHGLSKNICNMMLDHINKKEEDHTRLEYLIASHKLGEKKSIDCHLIFVTTSDKPDYRAIILTFCSYLQQMQGGKKEFPYDKLKGAVAFVFNKVKTKEEEAPNAPGMMKGIFDDLKENANKNVDYNNLSDIIGLIKERVKKVGAVSCENISSFDIREILSTIKNLNKKDEGNIGMKEWCKNISETLSIRNSRK